VIEVTRLNGTRFLINPELIEQIESAPDTVITLTTGNNIVVKEKIAVVVEKIIDYRRTISAANASRMDQFEFNQHGVV